jgi:hypothetical protein
MNALTATFTIKAWHVDYQPNRQTASVRSGFTEMDTGTGNG